MQYRTSKKLFEFSNQNFYESKVLSYKTGDYTIFESEIGNGLVFIDTAGSDSEEKFLPESESLKNDTEVELTLKIFDILKDKIITSNEKYNIGIISPYKAQVYQLKESFQKKEIPVNIDLDIDTIDSFQGSERDIIIISLVRSNDLGEIGFLKDYRRMNVALTRAIKTIIILGDSSTITLDSFYERLFDYARDYGTYKTIWEFL
jgi:superfamily I DNA and/or RNA helicase